MTNKSGFDLAQGGSVDLPQPRPLVAFSVAMEEASSLQDTLLESQPSNGSCKNGRPQSRLNSESTFRRTFMLSASETPSEILRVTLTESFGCGAVASLTFTETARESRAISLARSVSISQNKDPKLDAVVVNQQAALCVLGSALTASLMSLGEASPRSLRQIVRIFPFSHSNPDIPSIPSPTLHYPQIT